MSEHPQPRIVADENIPYVRDAFANVGEVYTCAGRDLSAADVADADILLVRSVTPVNQGLLEGSRVSFVATATAGYNHVDIDYLREVGIGFARAAGSNALSAAQYVIAALCYWSRHTGRDLAGLRLGVIGAGQVGSRVVHMATQIGLHCVVNDPPLEAQGQSGLSSLEQALDCDILTLHTPYTRSGPHATEHLLSAERIAGLTPGTVLINASRGEVVDEAALLARMQRQRDLTLMLDVWANEPDIDPRMMHECLLATPHIAGYSMDGKLRGTQMILEAVCQHLGIHAAWQASDVSLPGHPAADITIDTQLVDQVLSHYDIGADDQRLRSGLGGERPFAEHFDALRKHYPIRREFSLR